MELPRCMKCGRRLKNPESIGRGMGPKCAGTTRKGRHVKVRIQHLIGSAHLEGLARVPRQLVLGVGASSEHTSREEMAVENERALPIPLPNAMGGPASGRL
jgi:uncharacterized protein DUF6011